MNLVLSAKMLAYVVVFFVLLIVILRRNKAGEKLLPPGPARLPIIGSIPFVPRAFRIRGRGLHTPKLFYYLAQKYGAVCHIWLGPVPTIVISDAKILREAFKNANMSSRPILKPFHEFRYGSAVNHCKILMLRHFSDLCSNRKRNYDMTMHRRFFFTSDSGERKKEE